MASAISTVAAGALIVHREFSEGAWLEAPAPAISRANRILPRSRPGMPRTVYEKAIALMGRQIDGGDD